MPIDLSHAHGSISVYNNYVISIINEGVTVTLEINDIITSLINPYFQNNKFIYIAHRIYSYAVDPAVYNKISQIENLVAVAVVSANRIALNNAELEKLFINKPFEIFYTIEEAQDWANNYIKTH